MLVDAEGEVKLLDFGIAKLLDAAALQRETDVTVAPFTPDYAAPEQLSGEPVTTATDIYALACCFSNCSPESARCPPRACRRLMH